MFFNKSESWEEFDERQKRENPHMIITDKVVKLIKTSDDRHRVCVNNYICLANQQLHEMIDNKKADVWKVMGASLAIKQGFEEKFGKFKPWIISESIDS